MILCVSILCGKDEKKKKKKFQTFAEQCLSIICEQGKIDCEKKGDLAHSCCVLGIP